VANGKDASAPRYIMTRMNDISNYLFPPVDDPLLSTREDDDGNPIEPTCYIPIIPMVLINGSEGIGTGFSTTVPSYDPKDVIANIRNILEGKEVYDMTPWYKDFKGTIEKIDTHSTILGDSVSKSGLAGNSVKFRTTGVYERVGDAKLRITELPVGNNKCKSFTAYKEFLEKLVVGKTKITQTDEDAEDGEAKKKKKRMQAKEFLKCDPEQNGSDDYCDFIITFVSKDVLEKFIADGTLLSKLNLTHTISTSNMYLFNENDVIEKYDTVEDILKSFYTVRLSFYNKRKAHLLEEINKDVHKFQYQMEFLTLIVTKRLKVYNIPKETIIENLKRLMPNLEKEEMESLMRMGIHRLTQQEIQSLQKKIDDKQNEYNLLEKKAPNEIWKEELNALLDKIEEFDRILLEEKMASQLITKKPEKKGKRTKTTGTKQTNKKTKII
jgi:DNA topoisomerase-2